MWNTGNVLVFASLIKHNCEMFCSLFLQVYNLNKDNQSEGSKCL